MHTPGVIDPVYDIDADNEEVEHMGDKTDVVDTVEDYAKDIAAGTQDSGDTTSNTDDSAQVLDYESSQGILSRESTENRRVPAILKRALRNPIELRAHVPNTHSNQYEQKFQEVQSSYLCSPLTLNCEKEECSTHIYRVVNNIIIC